MSRYWNDGVFQQPSVDTLQKNAAASANKETKKGKKLEPVIVTGRKITSTWWGNAWCRNLEQYADFETRLERGRRYVRAGTVIDLKISQGKIAARVQGSRKTPYKTEIHISPLSEEKCQTLLERCGQKADSMEKLLSGDFPEEMKSLFSEENGLFPAPREISFNCSCPDWALMCKHVAAVLYGVGVRLDSEPLLFFTLRGLDVGRFVDTALANRVENMLANAMCNSNRILNNEDEVMHLLGLTD